MPVYITLSVEYERQLQRLAEESMRTSRQQAAWLLREAIERAAKDRDRARERELHAAPEADHAPEE